MEDKRTMLFDYWLDLANDKKLSTTDCGMLFFRSLVLQWFMIHSSLFFSVGLMYDFIFCTKKKTDNK